MLLKDTNIVLSGSNRGIGLALLHILSENGANIFACTRKKEKEFYQIVDDIMLKNDNIINPIHFDFEDIESTKEAAGEILRNKKKIHAIINNAGIIQTAPFLMTKISDLNKLYEVNYSHQLVFNQILIDRLQVVIVVVRVELRVLYVLMIILRPFMNTINFVKEEWEAVEVLTNSLLASCGPK